VISQIVKDSVVTHWIYFSAVYYRLY